MAEKNSVNNSILEQVHFFNYLDSEMLYVDELEIL